MGNRAAEDAEMPPVVVLAVDPTRTRLPTRTCGSGNVAETVRGVSVVHSVTALGRQKL